MLKENTFVHQIEGYMFEEHTMIRRAAIQCWTNLCTSPLMAKRCEAPNDLVKYTVLLIADDEDPEICKAAAGALAMLTGQSDKCCKKVFESIQWVQCLLNACANENYEIVLRGVVAVKNMIFSSKDVAEQVIETQLMDCMQAHIFRAKLDEGSAVPDKNLAQIRIISEEALKKAHEMKIIKSADEAAQEEDVDDDEEIKFNRRVEKLGTK